MLDLIILVLGSMLGLLLGPAVFAFAASIALFSHRRELGKTMLKAGFTGGASCGLLATLVAVIQVFDASSIGFLVSGAISFGFAITASIAGFTARPKAAQEHNQSVVASKENEHSPLVQPPHQRQGRIR